MPRPRRTPEERFWKFVTEGPEDECWLWQGAKMTGTGYGAISKSGYNAGRVLAHRVSWVLHYGAIPEGMFVCHTCDVRHCVNPHHLFLGSAKDNMEDMWSKNRGHRSTKSCCSRGHLFTPDNTIVRKSGRNEARLERSCKTCRNNRRQKLQGEE